MLQKLEIRNFQAHEHLRVTLDPRVTTIVGRSDVGKSAIIRAITWLATNRPTGTEYINWAADAVRATLWVDGHIIRRTRGPELNLYQLDDRAYRAFGQDVPPDIATLLNIDAVNIQGQHDPPFWLVDPPAQVSRNLNTIVNLGIIDETVGRLAAGARRARVALELAEEQHIAAKRARTAYNYVTDLQKDWAAVETAGAEAIRAAGATNALAAIVGAAVPVGVQAARYKERAAAGRAVVRLGVLAGRAGAGHTKLAGLLADIATAGRRKRRRPPDMAPLMARCHAALLAKPTAHARQIWAVVPQGHGCGNHAQPEAAGC
jgi:hypothetical protein